MRASAPLPPPWARLSVVRGASPRILAFRANEPRVLRVGSAQHAEVLVPESCAAPEQLEVLWDGAALWLQDRLRLGSSLVNGRPLGEWTLVRGQVLIGFGNVRMWLAAASPHPAPEAPDFEALYPMRGGVLGRGVRRMPTLRLLRAIDLVSTEAAGSSR